MRLAPGPEAPGALRPLPASLTFKIARLPAACDPGVEPDLAHTPQGCAKPRFQIPDMTNVVPIAGRHAIKSVSFGLEWQEPLQVEDLTVLSALHAKVSDKLPRVQHLQELAIRVVVATTEPERAAPAKPQLAGLLFDALQPNGEPAWSLRIHKTFLAVSCHDYSRWDEIWDSARGLMAPFVPILARDRGISVIGLQYVDQFNVTGDPDAFRARDLLREGSRLVPENVFGLDGLWHAHHGYFEQHASPTAHRRLNSVEVDVIDMNDTRLIQISTAHRAILDEPAANGARLLNNQDGGELQHYMIELHNTNKALLRDLLNEETCTRIALGGQS